MDLEKKYFYSSLFDSNGKEVKFTPYLKITNPYYFGKPKHKDFNVKKVEGKRVKIW